MVGVWAGGDIVTGAATVIEAMGAGRRAARSMKAWLGLRDSSAIYGEAAGAAGSARDGVAPGHERRFGIPRAEHGLARLRLG
jgi:glutamate synthase (NADPH/NADH) small chain